MRIDRGTPLLSQIDGRGQEGTELGFLVDFSGDSEVVELSRPEEDRRVPEPDYVHQAGEVELLHRGNLVGLSRHEGDGRDPLCSTPIGSYNTHTP